MNRQAGAISKWTFGNTAEGDVDAFELRHGKVELLLISLGARVVAVKTPDRSGHVDNIAVGFDNLAAYERNHKWHCGATVGRYANRIANGIMVIEGVAFALPNNDGAGNCLHGGIDAFDSRNWQAETKATPGGPSVRFFLKSRDGDNGFPGNLEIAVTYMLSSDALTVAYEAVCDKATVINPTNHTYWNLGGSSLPVVLDNELWLRASAYTPVDRFQIPTGQIAPVKGTPFDFTGGKTIGAQIEEVGGYDHNFVIDDADGTTMTLAARVKDPLTGRTLSVSTTAPGLQLFTPNWQAGVFDPDRMPTGYRAFCLETQFFPNSPNTPQFPSTLLRPGEHFRTSTIYGFAD